MDSLGIVLAVFCGGPFLFFWIGWFAHKFASRYKITRKEQVAEDAGYAQVKPTAAPTTPPPPAPVSQTRRIKSSRG